MSGVRIRLRPFLKEFIEAFRLRGENMECCISGADFHDAWYYLTLIEINELKSLFDDVSLEIY